MLFNFENFHPQNCFIVHSVIDLKSSQCFKIALFTHANVQFGLSAISTFSIFDEKKKSAPDPYWTAMRELKSISFKSDKLIFLCFDCFWVEINLGDLIKLGDEIKRAKFYLMHVTALIYI